MTTLPKSPHIPTLNESSDDWFIGVRQSDSKIRIVETSASRVSSSTGTHVCVCVCVCVRARARVNSSPKLQTYPPAPPPPKKCLKINGPGPFRQSETVEPKACDFCSISHPSTFLVLSPQWGGRTLCCLQVETIALMRSSRAQGFQDSTLFEPFIY